ncbi:MAG: hypothetical protein H7062_09985, partial [Candidatus Saccharimonas sp.]|nr:hypothetical protein [Planctomycetaceae bacterium]
AAAFVWLASQRAMSPTVTQHRAPAELRSEAARVFGGFDPSADPTVGLNPTERTEREEILTMIRQLEAATRADDKGAIRKLVDVPRLFARIRQTGKLALWSRWDQLELQMQVGDSCQPGDFRDRYQVVGIVPVADAPETRVVYAVAGEGGEHDQPPVRLWVARHGREWKVYDWERLDLGLSQSWHWAVMASHHRAGTLGDFELHSAMLTKFREQYEAGDPVAARKTLIASEQLRCPPEFADYDSVTTGYYWRWIHADEDAARCFEKVSRPEEAPGSWWGLMWARQRTHPKQALSAAEKYEAAFGPSPPLCEAKAEILNRLGRKSEAATEWRNVLRLDANHNTALRELLVLLPERDKSAFAEHLDRTTDPPKTAGNLATMVAWHDEAALSFLIDYVRTRQPAAPELASLTALQHSVVGDHEQAAESHLKILLSETDAAQQRDHATRYLGAMTQLGRVVEGFDNVPPAIQPATFDDLASRYFDGESELSRDEFHQVLAHFRQRHPDSPRGDSHTVTLALHDERYADAVRDARAALRRLDEQTSKSGEAPPPANALPAAHDTDDNANPRAALQQQLATALCHTGGIDEAWNLLPPDSRFSQLAWIANAGGHRDRVNELIRLQSASQPEDPDIPYFRARLAEQANRIDEAIGEYKLALTKSAASRRQDIKYALRQLLVKEGRWQEYYDSKYYDDTELESIAADLVRSQKWQLFDELMNRRFDPPGRARLAEHASEAAWERKRFAECADHCELALQSPESGLQEWRRATLRARQLASLIRQQKFDQARTLANRLRDDHTDIQAPAIVCAAAGELVNALAIAKVSADEARSAYVLYHHAEVGEIFLRDEFAELHQKFPVELTYDSVSDRTAVVLLKVPSEIDERQLAVIVQEAVGPGTTADVHSLSTRDPQCRAYCVGLGSASVWLVAGNGRLDPSWKLPEPGDDETPERAALRTAIAASGGYLLVGTAGWTNTAADRVKETARRVVRRFVGESAVAVQLIPDWNVHAPDDTLLDQWEATGSVDSRANRGALRMKFEPADTVVAIRQFQNELSAAARTFDKHQAPALEIIAASIQEPLLDPLTIRVTKVSRSYGNVRFEGVLQTSSLAVPALRSGLAVQISQHQVHAWRSGGSEFRWRP